MKIGLVVVVLLVAFGALAPLASAQYDGYVTSDRPGSGGVPRINDSVQEVVQGTVQAPDTFPSEWVKQGPSPAEKSTWTRVFGKIAAKAGRVATRLGPVGFVAGAAEVACRASEELTCWWFFESPSDGTKPESTPLHNTQTCTIPESWGPGGAMNCGGQTMLYPLASGLNGLHVHLLYSSDGGASTWLEPTSEGQDMQTCAPYRLSRPAGWNYVVADQVTGCSPSEIYWITVNRVFGWKSADAHDGAMSPRSSNEPSIPDAPAGFEILPAPDTDYDWREAFAEELKKPENADVEKALVFEAQVRDSIKIAVQRNPEANPADVAADVRACDHRLRAALQDPDDCHGLPIFLTGVDAAEARDHDASVLGGNPLLVRLNYWSSAEKVALGVRRDWYRGVSPCIPGYEGECDEYPFFSTAQGYDRNSQGVPVTGREPGNPTPSIRVISAADNQRQGNRLAVFYGTCALRSADSSALGGDPYLAVPLAASDPRPTHHLCSKG